MLRHTQMIPIEFVDMTTESSKKPLMALGKIPSVDVIRELLGLNAAPVTVKNAFRDITVEWRKNSRTSNSGPATGLVDWHSPAVQKDLHTLAEKFLAEKNNAERFWSASRPWKYDSKLQYPDDKERIIELLVQLFFKQNRYFKNNAAYGPWYHKDSESESPREGSTPQRMASIGAPSDKETKKLSRKRPRSETAENTHSPTSNFIDLSGSFGSSPTFPCDRPLPTTKDIYDMPDEQEPVVRQPSSSHSSSFHSKQSQSEHMWDTNPSKRRAKYSLRARTSSRFNDTISDAEFEQLMKEMENEDSSSDEDYPQRPQVAPVAPMMNHMDLGPSGHQPPRQAGSSDTSEIHRETITIPKGKPNSGPGSSQMPPPPRASKKTPSTQHKSPKSRKIIIRHTKKSFTPSGTLAGTHTTPVSTAGYMPPTVEDDIAEPKAPSVPPSSQQGAKSGNLPRGLQQKDLRDGPAQASGMPIQSASQPTPTPSPLQQNAPVSSASAADKTPSKSPQPFAPRQAETQNNTPATTPGTAPAAITYAESGPKSKADVSSSENRSQQRPKPQMNFFIVTREPRDTTVFWPEGKIQGASLSEFIACVAKATQRGCIEKLDLTLKTSTSDTKVPVARDDEGSWHIAKKLFTERLKAARTKCKSKGLNGDVNPEIYVEPFYTQAASVEDVEEEVADEDEEISFF